MRRNVASQAVGAQMVSATDGSAFTGSVTVSVTGDAGTQATGSVGSGACTHEGNGYHTYAPAQAETNYALVAFTFTGTGAIPVTVQIYTLAYSSTGVVDANVTQFGGSNGTFSGGRAEVNTSHWGGTAVGSTEVRANLINIAGSAVNTASAQLGVNVVNAAGTAWNSGGITANTLASDCITAAKIATGAIDADAIADNAIDAGALAADCITAAKIANNAIDAATFAADVDAEILSYLVDDATRIDASALNTLSSHDPGETIMGATDLGTGSGFTSLATQASVDDLPTNAELATALGTADDAVLAAINDLPTNAELATALGTADDAVLAAIAALNDISVADILGATVEGSTTLVQALRLLNAALGGKSSGLDTTEATYRDVGDTKDRIVATVDEFGNRSAVTLDLT